MAVSDPAPEPPPDPAPDPGAAPWALQVVLHVERTSPPTWTQACEAVSTAVVRLLSDPRSRPDGAWHDDVVAWRSRQIRKVVRRARGAAWERAAALPGVGAAVDGAEAWAVPPRPVDAVPRELSVLQVGGTDLADPAPRRSSALPDDGRLLVAVTPDVPMSAGKAAAQCGHATQLAWEALHAAGPGSRAARAALTAWEETGLAVAVARPSPADWSRLATAAPVAVRDAGFTEVPPGTCTAVAVWG